MSIAALSGSFDDFLTKFIRIYESFREGTIDTENYRSDIHGPLVEADLPSNYEEVERYWVNAPFAFVSIGYNPEKENQIYHVSTPSLSEFEQELFNNLREDTRDQLLYSESDTDLSSEEALQKILREVLSLYGVHIDQRSYYRILYYINRVFRGYRELDPLLNDPHIEDISCDGPDMPLFVYHSDYNDIKTNINFDQKKLDDLVVQLAQISGRQVSIGDPITNATLPDGSRAELVYTDEVSPNGSAFTIRKYSEEAMTPIELIDYGTFSIEQMAYFWLAIEYNKNLIFTGGTASGKTTSLNAVSMFLPSGSKVITIEDTREITLSHENWLSNITREQGSAEENIEMFDLLRSALRHRPEYIIVGEIRGEEAVTLFQAMNTGHTTFSTMHADSVQTVINRLENDPINIPRPMIESLDILSVQRQVRINDQRERRSSRISEIQGIDQRTGELEYSDIYQWDGETDSFDGNFSGSNVLDEIREDQGWSEANLRREFRNRELVLRYLYDQEITDIGRFTSVINKYSRDPDEVIDRIQEEIDTKSSAPVK